MQWNQCQLPQPSTASKTLGWLALTMRQVQRRRQHGSGWEIDNLCEVTTAVSGCFTDETTVSQVETQSSTDAAVHHWDAAVHERCRPLNTPTSMLHLRNNCWNKAAKMIQNSQNVKDQKIKVKLTRWFSHQYQHVERDGHWQLQFVDRLPCKQCTMVETSTLITQTRTVYTIHSLTHLAVNLHVDYTLYMTSTLLQMRIRNWVN